MKNKKILIAIIALTLFSAVGIASVEANPFYFPTTTQTSTATSSPAYIGVGTATSTFPTINAYSVGPSTGSPTAMAKGTFLLQFIASSSSSVLNISFQYSQDNIDWYNDAVNEASTTNLGGPTIYSWKATAAGTSSIAVPVQTPTHYMRAVFSMTGAAGAVWAQFVPVKEVPNND